MTLLTQKSGQKICGQKLTTINTRYMNGYIYMLCGLFWSRMERFWTKDGYSIILCRTSVKCCMI